MHKKKPSEKTFFLEHVLSASIRALLQPVH